MPIVVVTVVATVVAMVVATVVATVVETTVVPTASKEVETASERVAPQLIVQLDALHAQGPPDQPALHSSRPAERAQADRWGLVVANASLAGAALSIASRVRAVASVHHLVLPPPGQ